MDPLLSNITFDFLIVFIRISSVVMILPGFSEAGVPPMARIGLSIALTTIIAPLVANVLPTMPQMPVPLLMLITEQIVIGITIGWLTRTILTSLPMAGQAISYQIGLSSVLLPSTDLGSNSTLIASVLNLLLPVMFFGSAMIVFPILALINSFHQLPADFSGQWSQSNLLSSIMKIIVQSVAFEFLIATQIAAPFLVIGLIWQAGLALMAKASPQLQIFFVAAPLQILVGLILFAMFLHPILETWRNATSHLLLHYIAL
ncbi:MAG: flagellar biosynthetic protein FliR [Acidiphilium sp.]|nr:flagellar biosynthetic protein FliR [Acidiphilium sp.]MDD4936093.1 flagellar biosynthetic protein FliR [Acidiphilium sp.]